MRASDQNERDDLGNHRYDTAFEDFVSVTCPELDQTDSEMVKNGSRLVQNESRLVQNGSRPVQNELKTCPREYRNRSVHSDDYRVV